MERADPASSAFQSWIELVAFVSTRSMQWVIACLVAAALVAMPFVAFAACGSASTAAPLDVSAAVDDGDESLTLQGEHPDAPSNSCPVTRPLSLDGAHLPAQHLPDNALVATIGMPIQHAELNVRFSVATLLPGLSPPPEPPPPR